MQQSNSKPCHNCRRRRLRCDRSWPTCHKCAVSGQECLGYGKVFVWTQGIDQHGNLKSSSTGRRAVSVSNSNPPSTSTTPTSATGAFQPPAATSSSAGQPSQSTAGPSQQQFHQFFASRPVSPSLPAPDTPGSFNDVSSNSGSSAGQLTDPLFQDLDRNSRYYLAYCE